MAEQKPKEEQKQDTSGYVGVSPEYQNYADVRQKPFAAEGDKREEKLVKQVKELQELNATEAVPPVVSDDEPHVVVPNVSAARRG